MAAIPRIISVSRRTDIPAFYSDWFMNRLREGYALVPNPFNPRQITTVSLLPRNVACLVFVTKDPRPMLEKLGELESLGFRYIFQVTVTGLPRLFEPNVPDAAVVIEAMRRLARVLGSERVIWRFDPIMISDVMGEDGILRRFDQLSVALRGCTRQVLFSFARRYRQVETRMGNSLRSHNLRFPTSSEIAVSSPAFLAGMAEIASRNGMELLSCADIADLSSFGIRGGRCVDTAQVNRLFNLALPIRRASGQRPGCSCDASVDIGIYGTCPHGCLYCYARTSALLCRMPHDPSSPMLAGHYHPRQESQGTLF